MNINTIIHKKHIKALVPVAVALSLIACSSSTSEEPVVQADPPTDDDPTLIPDPALTPDPTLNPDPAPDTDTTSDETALESASRIDIPRYDQLISNVRAVVNASEFTSENYASAIAAIAESSQAHVVYGHVDFLSLLERQVIRL